MWEVKCIGERNERYGLLVKFVMYILWAEKSRVTFGYKESLSFPVEKVGQSVFVSSFFQLPLAPNNPCWSVIFWGGKF